MDIIKLPIEYAKDVVDSRFRLVLIAAQRARQISEGSALLVKSKYVKNTTLALEEAIEGKLKYLSGEDAKRARDFEYRMRRERMARESMEEATAASLEKIEEIKEAYKAETAAMAEETAKAAASLDALSAVEPAGELEEGAETEEAVEEIQTPKKRTKKK